MGLKQRFCTELTGMTRAVEKLASLGLIWAALSPTTHAQTVTATITVGYEPQCVAVNPVTNKIYVANTGGNTVTVIDGATNNTTTVTVGTNPCPVAVNPVTNKIYVSNTNGTTVTVIDGATNNATTVTVGTYPGAVAVNSVTNQIYIARTYANIVTVIDGATNNTTNVAVAGNPFAVAVNPVTNQIYVANQQLDSVTIIDGATNNTTTLGVVGGSPIAVAVNSVTNQIYVANYSGLNPGTVTVIDGATNNTTTVAMGPLSPSAVAVNPVTNQIYVVETFGNSGVTVIDGNIVAIAGAAGNTGLLPTVAVDSVTNKIYLTGGGAAMIDGVTNNYTTITAGNLPSAVAVNPNTNTIYIANDLSNNVTVLHGATISTTITLASNLNPSALNASVTFTAAVGEGSLGTGVPTGTVTFMDGSTALGTGTLNGSSVATYATSSLAAGQHSITAVYGGDANNAGSTSAVLTQAVNAPDFGLSSTPTSMTKTAGQSGTLTVTVTPQGSFTSPISFSCTGLPTLANCTFSPATITPNTSTATTMLTIATTAPTGALALPPFGHRSSPLYAMWLVLPAMLLGTVGLARPNRRKLLSYTLVCLLAGGCLLQLACSGANSNGGGGGGAGGTPTGTYAVTVTGAAGSTQHTTTVTLTVQ